MQLKRPNLWLSQILVDEAAAICCQLAAENGLADELRAKAFSITPENVDEVIQSRSHLLRSVYPAFSQFCQTTLYLQPRYLLETLWNLWLPLAMQLAS